MSTKHQKDRQIEEGFHNKLMLSLEMLSFTSEKQNYPLPGMKKIYGEKGNFIALVPNTRCAVMIPS